MNRMILGIVKSKLITKVFWPVVLILTYDDLFPII